MALLLETSLGDITIDLDIDGSPDLCRNLVKLVKARYYTSSLVYNVQEGRFCQWGDPRGDGSGGCSIYGLIDCIQRQTSDVRKSSKRFIKSRGRILTKNEMKQKGHVVAIEMNGIKDTIGSQFMITIDEGDDRALDGMNRTSGNNDAGNAAMQKEYLSLGRVTEDEDHVLDKINGIYCDKSGRPYADVRIIRAYCLDDPFDNDDPDGMDDALSARGVKLVGASDIPEKYRQCARWISSSSPSYERPKEEIVELRISTEDAMEEVDEETEKKRLEEMAKKEDRSNAVMLEMLGDLPSADMKPPENVLFVCKLNPITDDEDLQLIFSRFDPNAKAEIIRDPETGDSLQYAFVEFDTEGACNEAYFKMNNALIDDRRIKVDFSQSVSKEWNKYVQKKRGYQPSRGGGRKRVDRDPRKDGGEYGGFDRQNYHNDRSFNDGQYDRHHGSRGQYLECSEDRRRMNGNIRDHSKTTRDDSVRSRISDREDRSSPRGWSSGRSRSRDRKHSDSGRRRGDRSQDGRKRRGHRHRHGDDHRRSRDDDSRERSKRRHKSSSRKKSIRHHERKRRRRSRS